MRYERGQVVRGDGATLLARVRRPLDFAARALGLLPRRGLAADEGLWLAPCEGIHMFGMRFAIDVVFLRESRVVRLCRDVRPFRARWCRGADAALELAADGIDRLALAEREPLTFRSLA